MRLRHLFALLATLAAASGAQAQTLAHTLASAAPAAPSAASTGVSLDSLGMGDVVRVTVFRNPDLTTEARISEKGVILFPLIGEVQLVGLTPAQASSLIADRLREGRYVVNPEVTVSMAQINSRQVAVLGAVNKPGRYPLDSQSSRLTDFLAMAGGIAPTGADHVTLVATRDARTVKRDVDVKAIFAGDLSQNVQLEPGDTIFVEKAPTVYIYGEVQRAGAYRLEPHMTVMQALALGGGVTTRGTRRGIQIARRDASGVHEVDASLTDTVQSDDVIYVRESLF